MYMTTIVLYPSNQPVLPTGMAMHLNIVYYIVVANDSGGKGFLAFPPESFVIFLIGHHRRSCWLPWHWCALLWPLPGRAEPRRDFLLWLTEQGLQPEE